MVNTEEWGSVPLSKRLNRKIEEFHIFEMLEHRFMRATQEGPHCAKDAEIQRFL